MDDGKKKIWICLIAIVLTAIIAGSAYYIFSSEKSTDEGFLIRNSLAESCSRGDSVQEPEQEKICYADPE